MSRELLYRNDIRFTGWARSLSDQDWARPSLCTGWTNHDVLAHLVIGYRTPTRTVAGAVIAHRGSFDSANADLARHLALRRSAADLIDEFSALVRAPRGIGRVFPTRLLLGDHVIHELDICFALDRQPETGTPQLVSVLSTQVRVPNPFVPAAARARGLRLTATDLDWRHGDTGPLVTGGAAHLASALAGRRWALPHLHGEGVDVLAARG
ncbi:maleylpyruvate isomerase family mycothiol-dependent enzyme [soil metagenome]